ncbi:S8 family serine peptidase [Paenibacillus solani]|uniref:S8 family serine peptidase n=1 Tax=Paenibacillus solani TaxID=1705565 RepID=UPI000B1659DE|nr:S8 family serine peptidase [Paenibacillus solani]
MMRKLASSLLAAILLMASLFTGVSFGSSTQSSSTDYMEGQLVLSIAESLDANSLQNADHTLMKSAPLTKNGFAIADSLFGQDVGTFSVQQLDYDVRAAAIENMGWVYLIEYSVDEYESIDSAKKALKATLDNLGVEVRYISENRKIYALETPVMDDISIQAIHNNQRWHYDMIKVQQAWGITTGSSSVRVGVLDTGIDSNHTSLRNLVNTSLGRSFVDNTTIDRHGHGTHVAGTIASYGSVSGVMQNATLVPIKVLGDSGTGSMYSIQQGILHAANIRADVINMSLGGGGYDRGMEEAIQTAVGLGTIVVAATGNEGRSSISYPAAYSGSIAVGSVTSSRTRSSFSNYGPGLEVMAPGSNIYSTAPNGQYATMSGTSMATPHVAGVVGLMKSVNPSLTPAAARDILRNTAQPAGNANQYGYGIVDAHAAVLAAGGGGGTPQPGRETRTTVQTDKTVYQRGDNINITTRVTDQQGNVLQGASVNFTLTRPNGTVVTNTASTNSLGIATWSVTSNAQTALGSYQIAAQTTLSGYQPSSANASILFSDGGGGGDTQAPSTPGNLTTTGKTATSVSLSWSASTDNVGVTAYEVYQGSTLAATVTNTSATITGLTPNTTYTFTVKASDAAGNRSGASNAVTVTTDTNSSQPSPAPWAQGVSYKIGDEVTYGGSTYRCIQAHTSMVGWEPPVVPALWSKK